MRVLLLVVALLLAGPALAVLPDEVLDDPELEARARAISAELRCPVCRNESIDESTADISRELRLLVRERLVAGDSDAEVVAHIVDRYGEYVLFDPATGGTNLILWGAPLVLLILGGALATVAVTRRHVTAEGLTAEEEARLTRLMREDREG